jgi:hypothetical protein
MSKTVRITLDKFEDPNRYRAQISLEDKRAWAFGYNALFNLLPPRRYEELRRKLDRIVSESIDREVLLLLDDPMTREEYFQWLRDNCDDKVFNIAQAYIDQVSEGRYRLNR